MSDIFIDPLQAHEQATKISQANDKLALSKEVTFSTETSIAGNSQAESCFEQFKQTSAKMKDGLTRDIANIHSVVTTFERTDQEVGKMIEIEGVKLK